MNILQRAFKKSLNISRLQRSTQFQRQAIVQQFGQFRANQFASNNRNLIELGYEQNVDVYSMIRKMVEVSQTARWVVEKKKRGTANEWEEMTDTTLHELIANPNQTKNYTWNNIIEQTIIYLLAGGNAINLGMDANGESEGITGPIVELDVLPNRFITIKTTKDWFDPIDNYKFEIDTFKATFAKEEIQHFTLFNPGYNSIAKSVWGLSPIAVAARVVQVGNDRWDADAVLLQNRGAIGMIAQRNSEYPMTKEEALQTQEDWDELTAGPEKFGRIKVSRQDMRFIQMAMSPADLKLIEHGPVTLRAMCNVLGFDSGIFNDPMNKTFNNRKTAEIAMLADAVGPLNKQLATGYTRWLVPTHFPTDAPGTVRMRADLSEHPALQQDIKEKTDAVTKMKLAGIITPDRAAELLDQPLSGDDNADKLIVTASNVLLQDIDKTEE